MGGTTHRKDAAHVADGHARVVQLCRLSPRLVSSARSARSCASNAASCPKPNALWVYTVISVTPGLASRVRDGDGGGLRAGSRQVRMVGLHGWHVDVLGEFVGNLLGRIFGNLERDLHRRASELEDPEGMPRVPGEQRIGGVVGGDPGVQSLFAPRDDLGRIRPERGRAIAPGMRGSCAGWRPARPDRAPSEAPRWP